MSDEVLVHTAEGAPTMPPEDIIMTTLNAASIKVTWASPPLVSANGVIKGKKNSNSNIFFHNFKKSSKKFLNLPWECCAHLF